MTHATTKMYNYHVWANGVIIDRLKELPQDIYLREIQTGFSSVSKVLSHMYASEYTWFDIITGKSMKDAFAHEEQIREQTETKSIEK